MFFRATLNHPCSYEPVGKGTYTFVVKLPASSLLFGRSLSQIDYVLRIPIDPEPVAYLDYLFSPNRIMRVWHEVNPDSSCGAIVELPFQEYCRLRRVFGLREVVNHDRSTVSLSALPFVSGSSLTDGELSFFASSILERTGRLVVDLATDGNAVKQPNNVCVLRDVDFALKLSDRPSRESLSEEESDEVSISRNFIKIMMPAYCKYYYEYYFHAHSPFLALFSLLMLSNHGLMRFSDEWVRESFLKYEKYCLWAKQVSSSSGYTVEGIVRLLFYLFSSTQELLEQSSQAELVLSLIGSLSQRLADKDNGLDFVSLDDFRYLVSVLLVNPGSHCFFTQESCYVALCDRLYKESPKVVVAVLKDWFRALAAKGAGHLLQLEKFIEMELDIQNQFIESAFEVLCDFMASLTIPTCKRFCFADIIYRLSCLYSCSTVWSNLSTNKLEKILVFLFSQHCLDRVAFSFVSNSVAMNRFLSLSLSTQLVDEVVKSIRFDGAIGETICQLTDAITSYQGCIAETVRVALIALVSPESTASLLNALLSEAFQDKRIYQRVLSRLSMAQCDQLSQSAQQHFIDDMKSYYDSRCTVPFFNASRHRFSLFSDSQFALSESILKLKNHVATTDHDGASRQTLQRYQLLND